MIVFHLLQLNIPFDKIADYCKGIVISLNVSNMTMEPFSGASLLNLSETETLKRSSSTHSLSISPTQPHVTTTPKFVRTHSRSRSDDSGLINFIPILRSASTQHLSDLASGDLLFYNYMLIVFPVDWLTIIDFNCSF